MQTVCLRLWESSDPAALLDEKGVQGLLEDELGEALNAFGPDLRIAAIATLSQMVTVSGTRNVISAEDLRRRVYDEDREIPPALVEEALERLESESKLVRRERRRDLYLYEITSEFLVPWISRRREELRLAHERRRDRRRLHILGSIAAGLLIVATLVAVLAVWALHQRDDARHQRAGARREASQSQSLALSVSARSVLDTRPDVSSLLALEAFRERPLATARSSAVAALLALRSPGLLAVLHGHSDGVNAVAFSPDGRMVASASDDATIRLWDVRSHKQLGRLDGHGDAVESIAFSADGHRLVSTGDNATVRLWDVRSRRQLGHLLTLPYFSFQGSVNLSPDGRILALRSFGGIVLRDVRTRRRIGTLQGRSFWAGDVAFSRDGRTVTAAGDGAVRSWDVRTRRAVSGWRFDPRRARSHDVELSPDGLTLAATYGGGARKTIRLRDVRSHRLLGAPLRNPGAVTAMIFSRDSRVLAVIGNHTRLWDLRTHRQLGPTLTGRDAAINGLAFSPDGRMMAWAGSDGTIRLVDLRAYARLAGPRERDAHHAVGGVFSADTSTLVAADAHAIRMRDVPTGRPRAAIKSPVPFPAMALSADGGTLAVFGLGGARVLDARTLRQRGARIRVPGDTFGTNVAVSDDGSMLAYTARFFSSATTLIRLIDRRTRRQWAPLKVHPASPSGLLPIPGLAFSPNGRILAAGVDNTIRLLDVQSHRPLTEPLRGHTGTVWSVAFSRDGGTLASGSEDGTIRLWDVRGGKPLGGPMSDHGGVRSVSFARDGRTLASVGDDGRVRLWDVRSHEQLGGALTADKATIIAAAFRPGGRTLVTAADDGTIQLWPGLLWRTTLELQREVCGLVGSGLSASEWARFGHGLPYRNSCP